MQQAYKNISSIIIMKHGLSDISQSRTTRVNDVKSERASRFLPYIKNNSHHASPPINFRVKSKRSISRDELETHVRRYDENSAITVLSIRFAKSESHQKPNKDEQAYIKHQAKEQGAEQPQQNQNDRVLPYLRYRKFESPEEQLKNMGYDPDIRLASEVYSDKVEEKKFKYVNKMEALKRDLDGCATDKRHQRMERSRIQVKILGQEIRRKRERQILVQEERRGHRLLQSLLKSQDDAMTV